MAQNMAFKPTFPTSLTDGMTQEVKVALNETTFIAFLWRFVTDTNAGNYFLLAACSLGFFSSIALAIAALPIGFIPIISFIFTITTNTGSFVSLIAMCVFIIPPAYTHYKKKDVYEFPDLATNVIKIGIRCRIVLNLFSQINWDGLELGKATSNIKQIFDDLNNALSSRVGDKQRYNNMPVRYLGKVLEINEMPNIIGLLIRAIDAINRMKRQENFTFELFRQMDLLLNTLYTALDYLFGKLDDSISPKIVLPVTGITNTMLQQTDGVAGKLNGEYEDESLKYMRNLILSKTCSSRCLSKAFSFSVDENNVSHSLSSSEDDEKFAEWEKNAESTFAVAMEELSQRPVPLAAATFVRIIDSYGAPINNATTSAPLANESLKDQLPDEIIAALNEFLKLNSVLAETIKGFGPSSENLEAKKVIFKNGNLIDKNAPDDPGNWNAMQVSQEGTDINNFFKEPTCTEPQKATQHYRCFRRWVKVTVTTKGKSEPVKCEILLPCLFMIDTNGHPWIALGCINEENSYLQRMSVWFKFDETNPSGVANELCQAAIGKSLQQQQKEAQEEVLKNKAKVEEFKRKVEDKKSTKT
jgi:hypothetical protein